MKIHHTKHHNAYVTNYNMSVEKLDKAIATGNTNEVVALQSAIKFNGNTYMHILNICS
jgi:Fe-Mn family superoxide dismutase